jgi:1-acyl-sn-glycerol-3-phosphate acyltransferase
LVKELTKKDIIVMGDKVIYYTDELNDEFSSAAITPKRIDGGYRYLRNGCLGTIAHILLYRIIAVPLGWIFLKIKFHHTIIGKDKLKRTSHIGYYLYGNHTNPVADAFIPSIISFPKKASVIVHPNNVSMPVIGSLTPYLGALPLPDDKTAMKNFTEVLKKIIGDSNPIVIYPEAHIWPYYTDIRNFKDSSFHYPVSDNVPVYCFTNTYHKKRFGNGCKIITYVDGPFYPDKNVITPKAKRQSLRNQVYDTMKMRAKENTYTKIQYIKKEKEA